MVGNNPVRVARNTNSLFLFAFTQGEVQWSYLGNLQIKKTRGKQTEGQTTQVFAIMSYPMAIA